MPCHAPKLRETEEALARLAARGEEAEGEEAEAAFHAAQQDSERLRAEGAALQAALAELEVWGNDRAFALWC